MPAIAGVFENRCCAIQASGSVQRVTSDGITLVILEHHEPRANAQAILDSYRRGDVQALHERSTDCAVVLFDEAEQRLVLSRDVIGMHPLYYRRAGSKVAFATTITDIIRTCGTPILARVTLARRLVHGRSPTAGETYFDDIYPVAPGSTVVVRHNGITTLRPAAAVPAVNRSMRFDDAADVFAHLFEQAVLSRLDPDAHTGVLVSGGLDSAAIITCANPQNVFGITYGADERRYVDALRARGYQIEDVEFNPTADVAAIERSVRALETPIADDVPITLERAAHATRLHGANTLMMGTWGDQVMAPFPPPHIQHIAPWRINHLRHLAGAFHRYMSDVPPASVFRAFMRASVRRHVPEFFLQHMRARRRAKNAFDLLASDFPEVASTAHPDTYAGAVHDAITDAEHLAALESTMKWGLANGLEVRLPFLDRELVQWLQTVPDEVAYRNSSLKPLLRAGLRDRLPPEIVQRRDKGDYTDPIAAGRPAVTDVVDALDGLRRLVDFGLMSPASARTTLAKLTGAPNIAEARQLASNLLALDAWLREFFEAQ